MLIEVAERRAVPEQQIWRVDSSKLYDILSLCRKIECGDIFNPYFVEKRRCKSTVWQNFHPHNDTAVTFQQWFNSIGI